MSYDVISDFKMPQNIRFGKGALESLKEEDLVKNAKKICIISDSGLEKVGLVDEIEGILKNEKFTLTRFTDIHSEPSFQLINMAIEHVKMKNVDLIIGIGGGSALDVAKATAALSDKADPTIYFSGEKTIESRSIGCILLPTTSGTGSEVTKNAIFGDEVEKVKRGIVSDYLLPDVSIIDPELTISCPPRVTAASGVDAFTHAIESYISINATEHTRIYAEKAMSLFPDFIIRAVHNGRDLEARVGMSYVSLFGGISLANAGVGAVHALAYPLGGEYKIEHGVANALLMPFVLEVVGKTCREDFVKVASCLQLGDFTNHSYEALASVVDYLYKLLIDLNLPTSLKELDVSRNSLERLSAQAYKVRRLLDNTPFNLSEQQILEIYKNAYKGKEVNLVESGKARNIYKRKLGETR